MNLYLREHKRLLLLFVLFIMVALAAYTHVIGLKVLVSVNNSATTELISTTREFNEVEKQQAYRSLELVKLIDPQQTYDNVQAIDLYWMRSKKYAGLTVHQHDGTTMILLDESLRVKTPTNPWEFFKLGCIYSHELSHAINDTKDPITEQLTDGRLMMLVKTNVTIVHNWKP
ncbi:MAG: hypothetical protein EBU46_06055 [Nitrosomonadaceae bacterium]|nr:hypothetical protein [Nitrosomonadaceae bacterium]